MTALLAVAEATGAPWVACARTELERSHSRRRRPVSVDGRRSPVQLHYVSPAPERYDMYYSVISNPLLWFIQHYLWDLAHAPVIDEHYHRAWDEGYRQVNRQMGEAAARIASRQPGTPLVMTQDYQLYLAPRTVRELMPKATLQHFVHIPWPTPQYWRVLPRRMRDAIVDGLLANDIVGFQSRRDVRNFLITCEENMGIPVDHRERAVLRDGRVTWVRSYPISIDTRALERLGASAAVRQEEERLAAWRPEKLIVRVDRTDPSKNIVRGFLAYERMLKRNPSLRRRVVFWAFLQPSRQDVPAYRAWLREIRRTVRRINQENGEDGWEPIRLELGESLRRAVAAYRNFDVLLVNPIYDGMNLVAKEGMLANRTGGVLVLSENAGAHEELGEHSLTINPFDVDDTAQALLRALRMPAEERRMRGDEIRQVIRANDLSRWINRQLQDLRELVGSPSAQAG